MEQNNVDNKNINPLAKDLINSNDSQSKINNPEDASNSIEKSTESDKSNESRENDNVASEGNESNNNSNENGEEGNSGNEGKKEIKENINVKDVTKNENNNMKDVDKEKKINNIENNANIINKNEDILLEIREKVNGSKGTEQSQNKNSTTEEEEHNDNILIKEGYDNKSNKSNDQLIIDIESIEFEQIQHKNEEPKKNVISGEMDVVEEKQHTEKNNLPKKVELKDEGVSEKKDKEIKQNEIEVKKTEQSNILIDNNLITDQNEEEEDDKEGSDNSFSNLIITNKEYFPKGINNLGLNCYMDSLLQCLFNITKLRNYFIEGLKNKTFNKESTPICYYYAKVMKDLLYSNEKNITPTEFKEFISKKNNLFNNNKAADSTDLFRNIIDSFLDEIEPLSLKSHGENGEGETPGRETPEGETPEGETPEGETPEGENIISKRTLFKEIQKEINNNYIYSLINLYNIVTYYCPFHKENEDNITYSIESDSNITFYLANIMKNRKKNINSPITLKECFEHIQQEKKNNEFYCSKCEKIVKGNSQEKIFYPPEILIIILNRGNGKTFKGNVLIDTILDLSTFIDKDGKELNKLYDKDTYYKIIGSCNHSESSSSAGHYTASCYNEEKNSFYYYNDTSVKKLDKYKYIGEPYILFYKRTKITNYNPTIDNAIIFNPEYQNIKPILNTLFNVFEMLKDKNNNNKNYSIDIIRDNYFIWEIKFEGKIPLIMNFSVDLPNYHLSSLTKLEGINQTLDKYLDIDIDIDLKENERIIYEKILQFLEYVNKNKNLLPNKKDCIIF